MVLSARAATTTNRRRERGRKWAARARASLATGCVADSTAPRARRPLGCAMSGHDVGAATQGSTALRAAADARRSAAGAPRRCCCERGLRRGGTLATAPTAAARRTMYRSRCAGQTSPSRAWQHALAPSLRRMRSSLAAACRAPRSALARGMATQQLSSVPAAPKPELALPVAAASFEAFRLKKPRRAMRAGVASLKRSAHVFFCLCRVSPPTAVAKAEDAPADAAHPAKRKRVVEKPVRSLPLQMPRLRYH